MKNVFCRCSMLLVPAVALGLAAVPMRADTITYTGSSQTFTATTAGVYDIVAYGAQGGAGGTSGGLGAEIGGDITLSAGEMLTIDVGGAGISVDGVGGGGGGTFVVASDGTPLLVAGGGGGGGFYTGTSGTNALTGTSGDGGIQGGAGGTNGSGGAAASVGGGGGAGFSSAGGSSAAGTGVGGSDYSQGLAGGAGYSAGDGGYGGGGGGAAFGGGGYSGGGGGGGSYLDASFSNTTATDAASPDLSDNGYVSITEVSSVTPEPPSLTLLALGLLGILLALKLRGTA